ncbi:hypothetical protein BH09GEM1_BH09GEM1_18630 [soil metagenome]
MWFGWLIGFLPVRHRIAGHSRIGATSHLYLHFSKCICGEFEGEGDSCGRRLGNIRRRYLFFTSPSLLSVSRCGRESLIIRGAERQMTRKEDAGQVAV